MKREASMLGRKRNKFRKRNADFFRPLFVKVYRDDSTEYEGWILDFMSAAGRCCLNGTRIFIARCLLAFTGMNLLNTKDGFWNL